jgi:hypothetical protein
MVFTMTALRLMSLPTHAAIEMTGGLALMAAPFVFGFGASGLLVCVLVGTLVVGLALSAATPEMGSIPVGAHFAFDRGLALGLLGGAFVLGVAGETGAGVALFVAAAGQTALNLTTRYSAKA